MTKSLVWMLLILSVTLLVQTTLLNLIALWGTKPNLLLLVFMILTINQGSQPSLLCGFILGLFIDAVSAGPLGYHSFAYTLCGYLFGLGKGKIVFDPIVMPFLMALIASFYMQTCLFLVSSFFHLGKPFHFFFDTSFLIELLYNLALSPFVSFIFDLWRNRLRHIRRGGFNG